MPMQGSGDGHDNSWFIADDDDGRSYGDSAATADVRNRIPDVLRHWRHGVIGTRTRIQLLAGAEEIDVALQKVRDWVRVAVTPTNAGGMYEEYRNMGSRFRGNDEGQRE